MSDAASRGAFYTPADLAVRVVDLALPVVPRGVVLDPSCGDGALLAAAASRLLALGLSPARTAARLVGVDSDPQAIAAARERLSAILGSQVLRVRLVAADFLLDDVPLPAPGAVIANPPFLSVKRGHLPDVAALRSRYRLAAGQFDAHSLFLERALSLLPAGGRWAFVFPRPVLGNGELAQLRRLALDEGGLDHVVDAGRPFAAAVEAVVLSGAKGKASAIAREGRAWLEAGDLRALPGTPIPIGASADEVRWWTSAAQRGVPLGELVTIQRGVEAGKRSPAVVELGYPGSQPLRAGDDVTPFRIAAPRRALAPGLPASVAKAAGLYEGPKLLVRRVSPRLIAAVDVEDHAVLNTLYVLRSPDLELLHALAAALNSAPLQRWFEIFHVGGDRIFPYVRASQLAAVPFPREAQAALARAGRAAANDGRAEADVGALVEDALG